MHTDPMPTCPDMKKAPRFSPQCLIRLAVSWPPGLVDPENWIEVIQIT
jgi:hypothetical protein